MNDISVVIPCFNVAGFLKEAVESCLNQTKWPAEIFIVDNGSTDDTLWIAKQLQSENPDHIQVLECSTPGASAARNMGWCHAKSDWIQFLDADDLLLEDKLERQSQYINDDISMVVGTAIYQQLDGSQPTIAPDPDVWKGTFKGEHAGNTCANLWSRKVLEMVNGWDENLANTQDYDLIFRMLCKNDNVAFSNKPDSVHRDREEGQISTKDPKGNAERALTLRIQMLEWLKLHRAEYLNENKEYYEQLLFTFINNMARFDLGFAKEIFDQFLTSSFYPIHDKLYYSTRSDVFLHKIFGFETSQKIKSKIRKLR